MDKPFKIKHITLSELHNWAEVVSPSAEEYDGFLEDIAPEHAESVHRDLLQKACHTLFKNAFELNTDLYIAPAYLRELPAEVDFRIEDRGTTTGRIVSARDIIKRIARGSKSKDPIRILIGSFVYRQNPRPGESEYPQTRDQFIHAVYEVAARSYAVMDETVNAALNHPGPKHEVRFSPEPGHLTFTFGVQLVEPHHIESGEQPSIVNRQLAVSLPWHGLRH